LNAMNGTEPSRSKALLNASLSRVRSVTDLAIAEIRLAAVSSLNMLLLILLSAGALMISWGLLVVCCLHAVAMLGVPWAWTALVLAAIHVLLATYLWHTAVGLSNDLTLPELRKTLTRSPSKRQEDYDAQSASLGSSRQATTPTGSA
jgi:Flp pilus assembly protein TadB